MLSSSADWGAVWTLLVWRARMIRNTLAHDSGLLGAVLGGLVYLAVIVVVSIQAWASGTVTRALPASSDALALSLLGMNLFVVTCIQGGALFLFRLSLQGDFRTARWQVLPVGRHALRRAYVVDALLNPGAIAALIATWALLFGYARPSTAGSIAVCVLASPVFVYLTQSLFILASELLGRFQIVGTAALLVAMIAIGMLLSALVGRFTAGAVPALVRDVLLHDVTQTALRVPPWGVPFFVAQRVDTGSDVTLFAALATAGVAAFLLVMAANRVAATSEMD